MPLQPAPATPDNILIAADHLRHGSLVAFPTETVYGLGADARSDRAVAGIFAAKGRPSFNPLIVHVADLAMAREWAVINKLAECLAAAFWPGGLTMVLEKRQDICGDSGLSDLVSAGLPSIAIRVPSHPVAVALLRAAGCPVAAPSANRSGHVSATTAAHVATDLYPETTAPTLAMILDDGPCRFGIESTIIDARDDAPILLRSGAVTVEELSAVTAVPVNIDRLDTNARGTAARSSPGQLDSHYAPSKPVHLNVMKPTSDQALLAFGTPSPGHQGEIINLSPTGDLVEAAANLFAALRQLDRTAATSIAAMPVPNVGIGRAINDRLRRAAAPRPA